MNERLLLVFAVAAAAVIVGLFIFAPQAMAAGWLAAFIIWSQVSLGGLALILIYRLVDGHWGAAFGPYLLGLTAMVPALVLPWVFIFLTAKALFPWAENALTVPADVAHFYLNPPSFALRSLIAFGGWTVFVLLAVKGQMTRLQAAVGLLFYGIAVNFTSIDWILSIDPPYTSTAFGAQMAIQQILAALAAVALFAPKILDGGARRDLAGLLLATSLGSLYFVLMSFIVKWYGDLPEDAAWYLRREGLWLWVAGAAALFGAAIPILTLLYGRIRASRRGLQLVGASALIGIGLHDLWLISPLMNAAAIGCFVLALPVVASFSMWVGGLIEATFGRTEVADA